MIIIIIIASLSFDCFVAFQLQPDQKRMHLSLLREAAMLYQEFMRRAKEGKRDIDLAACVLAQLQTIQDVHFQDTVAKLKAMVSCALWVAMCCSYVGRNQRESSTSPVAKRDFWVLSPPKQSSKPPQIETWHTINQLSFCQFLECQDPRRNAKPPYWKLSGDGSE